MSMTGLNVNAGIDAGSHTSKLTHDDKIIAYLEGFDLLKLREAAEVFFDEPVFSCVIALPDDFTRKQRDDIAFDAKKAGFKNVNLITAHEAMSKAVNNNRVLVYDFGASKSDIIIFDENKKILDNEIIHDISGNNFDKIFAEWLSDRFTLDLIDEKILLKHAEKIKINLSLNDFVVWREINISREDFERLIYFTVKRAFHVIERFITCYKPDKFIMTGGCCEIPLVKNIFNGFNAEFNNNLIAWGAAVQAHLLSKDNKHPDKFNNAEKFKELRIKLMEMEEFLTRQQKDRLYFIFKKAEGILTGDPTMINLLENMLKEISRANAPD